MSDQKLVSPLLDGFLIGDPISNHDGVRCCPAKKENTEDHYIVKIISVPASQKQLDALLLTGAFADAAGAPEYFKEIADGIVKEAKLLQQLSKLEGFLPYEGWQVVPMEDNNLGYEVYLLGTYKRSLEKYLSRNTMTHLGAVNLGLDLCAALSVCRRAGFMHVDLRPSNIYLSGDQEYRIGDLGFAKLNSLKYASLPSKYRSCYTPPELHNDLATLNPTADIYAIGMILYQIYNNGQLPFEGHATDEMLPAPANADYELAEIILKACHPNPRHRWQTPIEMGQALASYMQRNTVDDVPIVPPVAVPVAEQEDAAEDMPEAEAADMEEVASEAEAEVSEELAFMEEMVSDETAPGEEDLEGVSDEDMSDEVSEILAQANALLQSVEVPAEELPESCEDTEAVEEDEEEDDADDDEDEQDEEAARMAGFYSLVGMSRRNRPAEDDQDDDLDDEDDDEVETEMPVIPTTPKAKKSRGWIAVVLILLLLAGAACGGYYYYANYYLLPIENMDISAVEDTITVNLTTTVDESLLTVVCTDTYGNVQSLPVQNGQVVFTQLNADTMYDIRVEASGFHQTSKSNSGSCATAKQTEIVDFTAKTGNEDGSVILNFTVNGPEKQDWLVEYAAEGEDAQSVSFTGHMVTITGLTVDKEYTFTLLPADASDMWIVGSDSLTYTASRIIVAQNLAVVSSGNGVLTVDWEIPEELTVGLWTVRCYSETGFDETITVTNTAAEFSGIVNTEAYTVEVTAEGMSQSARAYVTANPTTIIDMNVTTGDDLVVTWDYSGNAPEGGWLMLYSMDGGKTTEVVKCTENTGTIETSIPNALYKITVQAADGSTVFGGEYQFTTPEAEEFEEYSLSTDELKISLCATPDKSKWTHKDVKEYSSTYAPGTKVSMVVYATARFYRPADEMKMMFIIRDSEGNVLPDLMAEQTITWRSIWKDGYAYLDIPNMPTEAGEYEVSLYFGGRFVVTKSFTIAE